MSEHRESLTTAPVEPLWCDGLDAELPTLVPDAHSALGDTADVELLCYCSPTNGKINCPAAWWTDAGLAAFFVLPGFGSIAPPGYAGGKEIVSCTFWEAVQDEWWHDSVIRVNWRHDVWKPPSRLMERLMFDARGWTCGGDPMSNEERAAIQESVRRSLSAAADRLRAVISTAPRSGASSSPPNAQGPGMTPVYEIGNLDRDEALALAGLYGPDDEQAWELLEAARVAYPEATIDRTEAA